MEKEFKELKNIVAVHFGALGFLNPSENEQILKDRDKVLNALNELKQIKEAKPSEALDKLEGLGFGLLNEDKSIISINGHYFKDAYNTIKNYILKAQKQEEENAELLQAVAFFKKKLEDTDGIKLAIAMAKQLDENITLDKELTKYKKAGDVVKENIKFEFRGRLDNGKYLILMETADEYCALPVDTEEEYNLLKEVLE